tara:strand:- start:1799 stop:2749 length:951 start_codon:yes stop_codon:yes gene_type:complete
MKHQRRYFLFRQTFQIPLKTAKGVWGNRASLVLREDDGNGRVSFGEFSPIPGGPDEDLTIATQEAKAWARGEDNADQLNYLVPAIQSLKSSIWTKMGEVSKISESAKLWGINNSAKCGVVKRKLGLLSPKDEIPIVLSWLSQLPTHVKVRLDPNESFSRDDLLRWTDALSQHSCVQYIEQPTGRKDDEWLIEHSLSSPIPLALDEALIRLKSRDEILQLPKNLYLVIKPILFNDWELLFELLSEEDRKIIFSTVFESPFGYEALIRLCSHSCLNPGLERSCFLGNPHEFVAHHHRILKSPAVINEKLVELWDFLNK